MFSTTKLLDAVAGILRAAGQEMFVKDICVELQKYGIEIERPKLTQILWNENTRPELVVDKNTFKWRYETELASQAEANEKTRAQTRKELNKDSAWRELWEAVQFEFVGVRRARTEKPLFFVSQSRGYYTLVGPEGNVLVEKSSKCSAPEPIRPCDFTQIQIKTAAEEFLKEKYRTAVQRAQDIIEQLRHTVIPPDDVYVGPVAIRVQDFIPASGIIIVANVSAAESLIVQFGWGTVLQPLYLVVNILGHGILSDTRYGVFKMCVYELIKRDLVAQSEGDLCLKLTLEGTRVYLGSDKSRRDLA